jgi:2-polyprenyl-3-methyl-5-hydroxy-6-metoxy-1,4-benzoquinol methylase
MNLGKRSGKGAPNGVRHWLERVGATLSRRLPAPPFMTALDRVEREITSHLLSEHADAVAAARASCAARAGGNTGRVEAPDTGPAEALAERLISSLRERMECVPWDRPLLALTARLDQAMPTDEGEYMDDHRVAERTRAALVRTLDLQTHRAGDYLVMAELLGPLLTTDAPLTVLDLASGPGGFPIAVARWLGPTRGVRVVATDIDPEYLEIARGAAQAEGVLGWMRFQQVDVFHLQRELGGWRPDIITCTRSLHHLGVRGTVRVLAQSLACATRGVLFVDIARSLSRMLMASGAGLGSGSWRFLHDAVISVRKSFTPGELRLICACVPKAEALDVFYTPPAYLVARGAS